MTVKPGWARKRDRLRRREAAVADASTAGFFGEFSAAEWRLLVITFVGGLGSIIGAACVIAGAIAFDRWVAGNEHGHINWGEEAVTSGVLVVLGVLALFFARRHNSDKGLIRTLVVVYGLVLASDFLIWVGLAAGVH